MKNKKIINDRVEHFDPYEFEKSLSNLKQYVDRLIKLHGPDARIRYDRHYWEPYDDAPSPKYELILNRLETDEEFATRIEREEREQAERDDRDREELERLKKKFGVK